MRIVTVEVEKRNFVATRLHAQTYSGLATGEALARIDMFALTANNVSYALSGEAIGYWRFFPAEDPWGRVPVWGFADIVESACAEVTAGTRIWGFFPMASHVILRPQRTGQRSFVDASDHRAQLPAIYNSYQVTDADPPELTALAEERCLLFPLFSTSYVLFDYLCDHAFFGAQRILIGGCSSKTGMGLAKLLHDSAAPRPEVVGIASERSRSFLEDLGVCDRVVLYGEVAAMDPSTPTVFVDMSGEGALVSTVHATLAGQLKASVAIGATHWSAERHRNASGGVAHDFFFAPAHFAKRDRDWGPGEILRRAQRASMDLSIQLRPHINIRRPVGALQAAEAFCDLVRGDVPARDGIIARMSEIPSEDAG
jgi:hypothetical protein